MKATVEFELDRNLDREEFMIMMRAGEYVHTLVTFGHTLIKLSEEGKDIQDALIAYNAALATTGLIYNPGGPGEEPLQ